MLLNLQNSHNKLTVDQDFPLKHLSWYLQDGLPYARHKSLFHNLLPLLPPGFKFVHINDDKLDCRKRNLLITHNKLNEWEIGLLYFYKIYPLKDLGAWQANYITHIPFTIPPEYGDDVLEDHINPPSRFCS